MCTLKVLATICRFSPKRDDFRLSLGSPFGDISPERPPFLPTPTREEILRDIHGGR